MAISNKNYFLLWRFLLIFLVLVLLSDLVLSQLSGSLSLIFKNHLPGIISGLLITVLACIRINYFSYEDEYEIIHIHSKSLLFGTFERPAQTRYEFPKRIIYDFEYKNTLFQKRLTIYLITQQGIKKVRKFNISFVPMRKLSYVVNSLEMIRAKNKEMHQNGKVEWS